jgi:hypothetical protein
MRAPATWHAQDMLKTAQAKRGRRHNLQRNSELSALYSCRVPRQRRTAQRIEQRSPIFPSNGQIPS